MKSFLLATAVALSLLPSPARAGDIPEVVLDLANSKADTAVTQTVDPGQYVVRFTNRMPGQKYDHSIIRENLQIPALDGPVGPLKPAERDRNLTACPNTCDALSGAIWKATSEKVVAESLANAPASLEKAGCSKGDIAIFLAKMQSATELEVPVAVRSGEKVMVTLYREGGSGEAKALRWTCVLQTQRRGTWLVTYGVVFSPDRDETFATVPVAGTAGSFVIQRDRGGTDAVKRIPAVFFSWMREENARGDLSLSPTGGLGTDGSSLATFLGCSLTYNSNLQLSAGVAVIPRKRLVGKYTSGQVIQENLTDDQLHRTVLAPNLFIAIAFRFGSNPFGSKEVQNAPATSPANK